MHKKDDLVKIYDEMFNLIGTEKWSTVHTKGLLHQVVHLWMYSTDPDGKWLYFVQRSKDREVFPGLYDLPVSGHIDPDETFTQTIITITEKRLGVSLHPSQLKHIGNIHQVIDIDDYHDNAFCQVYASKLELPIPEVQLNGLEAFFKVKYDEFSAWASSEEKSALNIYTADGTLIKASEVSEWWWPRNEEFLSIVKHYIDAH